MDLSIYAPEAMNRISYVFRRMARAKTLVDECASSVEVINSLRKKEKLNKGEIQNLSPDAFFVKYFWKNMWKCTFAATYLSRVIGQGRPVIDLGTGCGTFLYPIMILSEIDDLKPIGIDKSQAALDLAAKLFTISKLPIPNLWRLQVPSDMRTMSGVFLSSYMYVELTKIQKSKLLRSVIANMDSDFLIIDYPDQALEFHRMVSKYRSSENQTIELLIPSNYQGLIVDDKISFGMTHVKSRQY